MSDLDHLLDYPSGTVDPHCKACSPGPFCRHGEQSDPEADELASSSATLAKLRARVTELLQAERERNALRFAADGFREEVRRALDHAERPLGGQQVSPSGDFIYAQPSILSRLRWWARAFSDVSSFEYAVTTLTAERDGAIAEAAAAKRERDAALFSRKIDAEWSLGSFMGPCSHGRAPYTRCDHCDGLEPREAFAATVRAEEREACAVFAATEMVGLGLDEEDAIAVRDAIRARGGK